MPANELSVAGPLDATAQTIQDEAETKSALLLSTQGVQIQRQVNGGSPFVLSVTVPPEAGTSPGVLVQSRSPEASIRFIASDPGSYHIGVGGGGGKGAFFIWNDSNGIAMTFDVNGNATLQHDLTVKGSLTVDATKVALGNMPFASQAPNQPLKHVMIDPASGRLFYQ